MRGEPDLAFGNGDDNRAAITKNIENGAKIANLMCSHGNPERTRDVSCYVKQRLPSNQRDAAFLIAAQYANLRVRVEVHDGAIGQGNRSALSNSGDVLGRSRPSVAKRQDVDQRERRGESGAGPKPAIGVSPDPGCRQRTSGPLQFGFLAWERSRYRIEIGRQVLDPIERRAIVVVGLEPGGKRDPHPLVSLLGVQAHMPDDSLVQLLR